jgi:Subtilase family
MFFAWINGAYQQLSGTSMAAPYVAWFAARILQNTPSLNSQQLEAAVRSKFRYIGMQPWGPQPMYMPDFGN